MKRDHGRNADYYMAPTNCTASWQNTVQQKDYIDAKIREQIMIRSGAYTSGTDQQKSNLFPLLSVSSVSGMAIATNSGNDAPNKLLSSVAGDLIRCFCNLRQSDVYFSNGKEPN